MFLDTTDIDKTQTWPPARASASAGDAPVVPRRLTGKLWFIFTQMLSEADHARAPEEIQRSAWVYADQLQNLFGPRFGQGKPTPGIPRY